MDCPVCEGSTTDKFEKDGTVLYECQSCGLVFYDFHGYNLKDIYDQDYFVNDTASQGYNNYFSLENSFRKTFEKRLKKISRLHSCKGRVLLDVGCGPGYFLNVARDKGWQVKGVEICDFAAKYATENYGLEVVSGFLEEGIFTPGSFDLVTMWDVIEHLPDPIQTLKIINKILKPDGFLSLTTGDIKSLFSKMTGPKWHLINIPEHVFYFSPTSVGEVLNRTGFELKYITYESSYYAIEYLLERLEKTMLPGRIVKLFKKILPLKATLPVNLFDIMTVYAVKSHEIDKY